MKFTLNSEFNPSGDQPKAIKTLSEGLRANTAHQILLGVTGSGKTFTMAKIIESMNCPSLIIAHNKTLAAQLFNEFKEFFPDNAVEFFISYYDYYQPEAYIPSRDAYIEKEADINKDIERLRHSATRSLLTRNDVIIISSVSCIYGLGIPEDYLEASITLNVGNPYNRNQLLRALETSQYERNDYQLDSGKYRVKGDTIDIYTSWDKLIYRCEFFGDTCDHLSILDPITLETLSTHTSLTIFPATHYVVSGKKNSAFNAIKQELYSQIKHFENEHKLVESHRIKQRTCYDLDMMSEMGYCKGIENYSRHLSGRNSGDPPGVLLDFFPKNFITFIDESHVTVPQIKGMYKGDQSRKQSLIDFGFRLPSAKDNRPLNFEEFTQKIPRCVYVSATPGDYECSVAIKPGSKKIRSDSKWDSLACAQQIIRPTGLLDPIVKVRKTKGQIDDIFKEIKQRIKKKERVLITTLTKQMAEDLQSYFTENHINAHYIHSEIKTLERVDILHSLRTGKVDVLVGVNLLREGLDLPEVSLVIILDADKQGFLRNERSLIQTIGRAARHEKGTVILYADRLSDAMQTALQETKRRRTIQEKYNKKHNIKPKTIQKKLQDIRSDTRKQENTEDLIKKNLPPDAHLLLVADLKKRMNEAADNLEFELAAVLRDQLSDLEQMKPGHRNKK